MRRRFRKVFNVVLVTLMLCSIITPHFIVLADQEIAAVELPSWWAIEEISMAKIYELSDEGFFKDFKKGVTYEELNHLGVCLYTKLIDEKNHMESIGELKKLLDQKDELVTRRGVSLFLVNLIRLIDPTLMAEEQDEINYLVSQKILKGVSKDDLALDQYCSREEILTLINRTYEFVVQETGGASQGLLWKVSDDNSSAYVLGSIHMADNRIYPFNKKIKEAYEKAAYLAVEANIVEDQEGIQYMVAKALYTDDNTLKDNVSAETYEHFVKKLEKHGLDSQLFEKIKPWYAALLVQGLEVTQDTIDPTLGIDHYFLSKAMGVKPIIEMEGLQFQVDLFDGFPLNIQEQFLAASLVEAKPEDHLQDAEQVVEYMLDLWKQGNALEFERFLDTTKEAEENNEFNQKFWLERDKNMVNKIEEFLADEENNTYFVVVGAGHLVGKTGVIQTLKDKGYQVEQVIEH